MTENNGYVQARVRTTDSSTVLQDRRKVSHDGQQDGKRLTALSQFKAVPPVELLPASQFTFEELTSAYNQTRVD